MLLGERLGLESQLLADIANTSTGHCWSSEVRQSNPEGVKK
jgi:3-hydroxyisobutyrate dehydrogenase-like beta-hydroxyacid dehydrogenase